MHGIFVGKGYRSGGLFVLNVASSAINENASSAYIAEFMDLWHGRFVPSLHRNLISSCLLNIAGFEVNQKAGKIIILHNGVFVGKGYPSGGLFVLNVVFDAINENASSAYTPESVDLWHGRLGHVNASINKLKTCD